MYFCDLMRNRYFLNKDQTQLLILALPIIFGNLSQMLLNIIDALMVGQLGYKELAASSLVNNILGIPFVACIGLTTAISPIIAEYRGTMNNTACGRFLNNAVFSVIIISVCIIFGILIFGNIIYGLRQDPEVASLGKPFLNWMTWSILPMIIYLSIKQFYDGLEQNRFPMMVSLGSIFLNTFLNYILVFGHCGFPAMGLEGSGIATFITRLVMVVVLLIHFYQFVPFKSYDIFNCKLSIMLIKKFLKISLPSSWQYTSEIGAFVILAIIVGWFGAIQQAAHHIAISIAAAAFMISMGLSTAGSIKVGQAMGSGDISSARKFGFNALLLAFYYAIFVGILFVLFRNVIPQAFTKEHEVIWIAGQLLLFAAAFQISDALQAVGIGILRGMQDVKLPTLYTTLAYWGIGIPLGYFLANTLKWEVYGVWTGFIVCLTVMAFLLIARFNKITLG